MEWKWIVDGLGWIGSVEIILAYVLVSYEKLSATSKWFQWLNLTGSVGLLINTAYYGAFPSTVVNVVWFFIALFALYRILKRSTT
ncbi:MAG: hypothetical protein HKN76_06695 [Saprospiraceae bacterium]|nr:hypothetical protein [Saprospiraceae bacterium]